MPRYDEFYDRPQRYAPPPQLRRRRWSRREAARVGLFTAPYRAHSRYRAAGTERASERFLPYERFSAGPDYGDDFGEYRPMGATSDWQFRMGMRDFSERYGRYSGGSPYSYEYSERTIYHRPRTGGLIGFTRPLEEDDYGGGYRYPWGGGGRSTNRWRRR